MILITGATGKLGGKVIETLLKNKVLPYKIVALARDESKAAALKEMGVNIRIGDYDNRHSLDEAMREIDKVLLLSALDTNKLMEQHRNVVDAAKGAALNAWHIQVIVLRTGKPCSTIS